MSLAFVSSSLFGLVLVTSVVACDKSVSKPVATAAPVVELPSPPEPEVTAKPEAEPSKPAAAEARTSSEGRFTVMVAGEETAGTRQVGKQIWSDLSWRPEPRYDFRVSWRDITELTASDVTSNAAAFFDEIQTGLAAIGTVSAVRDHQVGERKARDLTNTSKDGEVVLDMRLVVDGTRLYMLAATRAADAPSQSVAFLDSFTITPAATPGAAAAPTNGAPIDFEAYASAEGKFKLLAPADARAHEGSVEWSWLRGPGALGVTWEDLARTPTSGKATDKALAAARDAFLELFGAELVSEEPVEVSGAAGAREVTYTTPDPDAPADTAKRLPCVARIVIAGARVYVVSGRRMEPGAMDGFQHFVRSFAVEQ